MTDGKMAVANDCCKMTDADHQTGEGDRVVFFYRLSEYLRPWKLATLFLGTGLLVLGSIFTPAPDWDLPISFIMAFLTYLTAPWSIRVLLERRWRHWPAMLFATWFSVDGCYALYWHFKNPTVLVLMREVNFLASLALYSICGLIWLHRGTLRELFRELRGLYPTIKGREGAEHSSQGEDRND